MVDASVGVFTDLAMHPDNACDLDLAKYPECDDLLKLEASIAVAAQQPTNQPAPTGGTDRHRPLERPPPAPRTICPFFLGPRGAAGAAETPPPRFPARGPRRSGKRHPHPTKMHAR